MDDNKYKTIVIYGSVGIGKTALMMEFLKVKKDLRHIFWYEMSEDDTQLDVFTQLSEFLSALQKTNLKTYLDDHDKINLDETLRILEKDLKDIHAILAFDNYFKVSEDVSDLFSGLLKLAAKQESWNIIINALDTTPFYCRFYDKSEINKKKIAELTIKGMDMEGCMGLLEAPNIDQDALKKIHLMTRGNPLTIELIKIGDVNSLKRIKGFSRQEASLLLYLKGVESK
jgi:AAA+ ATPase superfamily predicted ATPase